MSWIDTIMDVYWELRPCAETQAIYKKRGLTCFDYWRLEIEWLINSTWNRELMYDVEYLFDKYSGPKIRLDDQDRQALMERFIMDLGMYPSIFPFSLKNFSRNTK
jgi:hypothetical protein